MFVWLDVPSPPGTPQITDSDETSVNLIWERPKSDGGSKIHGYQVEYRDPRDGRWKSASDQLIKDTSFRGIIMQYFFVYYKLVNNHASITQHFWQLCAYLSPVWFPQLTVP